MEELVKILGNGKTLVVKPSLAVEKVIPWEKAVTLLMFRDAYAILNREDRVIRSVSLEIPAPLVIARQNSRYSGARRYRATDPVSKKTIRVRDNYTCQYCGSRGATVDHILPKALGGTSTWGNLCVACRDCNQAKGHKTLTEIGFPKPIIPESLPQFRASKLQEALFRAVEVGH